MTTRPFLVFVLFTICGAQVRAADAWVLRSRDSVAVTGSCSTLQTHSELVFQNAGTADARVKLLAISNDGNSGSAPELNVAAARTVTIDTFATPIWSASSRWWAVHLDVPDAVFMANRLNLGTVPERCPPTPQPPSFSPNRGRVALPVFRALVPANVPQRHLASDSGARDATVTAVVFNAGAVSASAHVQLYRACDDTVVAERTITLSAKSADSVALPLLISCDAPSRAVMANGFTYYTVVTVDQPSLTLVISSANLTTPANDLSVAVITPPQPAPSRSRAIRRP